MVYKLTIQTALSGAILANQSFTEGIRDIQPPAPYPPNYFLIYLLLGILGLIALFFLIRILIKLFKKPKKEPGIVKPSWTLAYECLEELKKKNLPAKGLFKEYYTSLSDIVRRYIENRFRIKAPEMTTQEFLLLLKEMRDFSHENKKSLEIFLNSCDLVKFARYGPSLNETDESFKNAKKVIDETKEASASGSGKQL